MATIFRPPLYTRIHAREWDRALRSQPNRGSSTIGLTAPVVTPLIIQCDQPNPQIPRFSVELRTWLNASTYELISLGPVIGFAQLDSQDFRKVQQMDHQRNVALLNNPVVFPPQNRNQPNPQLLGNRAAWAYSVTQRNMQTQPPNPGSPITSANYITQGNPVILPFSPSNRGLMAGLNALPITPPPVGGTARSTGIYLGMRIGL
jgi:hypothetical protein